MDSLSAISLNKKELHIFLEPWTNEFFSINLFLLVDKYFSIRKAKEEEFPLWCSGNESKNYEVMGLISGSAQ